MQRFFLPGVIALSVTFLLSFHLHAQSAKLAEPVKVTSVEGITEYRLANGLRVLLFPDPSKSTITVNVTYLVGSRHEGYGETGMAHLLEHMVFKGSKKFPDMNKEFTAHGCWSNGSTWYDRTNYFETFTATDENLRWALDFESDRMVNSFIAKKDLESEFSVVRNEFELGENQPAYILEERVMSAAYLWHNYGKATIGSKEDIELVPIERLQAFYKKYYQPDNAVLIIAGKIDEAKTLALVNEYFGVLPKPQRVLEEPYTVEPVQDGERHVELKRAGDIQVVGCGYHIPSGSHADYAVIEVLTDLLITPAGRLYNALVEPRKATAVSAYPYALKDPGFVYFYAEVLKDKPLDDAKVTMLQLFDHLSNHPVTDEEVERSKNTLLKDFDLAYNNSDEVGITISEYIAMGDWRLWFIYRDNLEQVTAADVNRVAQAYFKPSNRTVGVFIPDNAPERAPIPAAPDVDALVKDYKGKAKLSDAEAFDASPANIDSRTKTGTLAGGAKYALLKKTTRGGSVIVNISLYIGTEAALQDKSTVTYLTGAMLERGTQSKTYRQLKDAFDKLKADFYVFGSGQNITVSVQTVDKNLPAVLQLVTEMLRKPAFNEAEFEKVKEEELGYLEKEKTDPWSVAFTEYERTITPYPKPDFRYPMTFDEQIASVKSVTLNDVKKFYSDFFNGQHAVVSVVGAFDEQAVLAALKPMLENWTSSVSFERAKKLHFEVTPGMKVVTAKDKKSAAMVSGCNLQLQDSHADYPALVIANYMLGGGSGTSRMFARLREKEGFCYTVGTYLTADPIEQVGVFGCYASYNPDNADSLMRAYQEELDKVLKEGFSAEELKTAVAGYLQEENLARSQDLQLAYLFTVNLHLGRTMQHTAIEEKKITALTVEEVNAALRRWIKPEKFVYVQAGEFDKKGK